MTLTNHSDEVLAEHGAISPTDIRTVRVDTLSIDTDALPLCLPQAMINSLGLIGVLTTFVPKASAVNTALIYGAVRITLEGRSAIFECLALTEGNEPLLGVIPLDRLGLEPDLDTPRFIARSPYIRATSPQIITT